MPFGPCQASFKNSRIYPKPATTSADTGTFITQPAGAGGSPNGNTIARPPNPFRVYLSLRNTSPTDDMRYGYEDRASLNVDGFLLKALEAVDIQSPGEIYTVSLGGPIATDWDEGNG